MIKFFIIFLTLFIDGCKDRDFNKEDLYGVWVANDGSIFCFNEDGEFVAKKLPGKIIFKSLKKYEHKVFDESGRWKIEKWQDQRIVALEFNQSKKLTNGYATRILISGHGLLEIGPPWYLFLWEEEEGTSRYKFFKDKSKQVSGLSCTPSRPL